MTELCRVRLVPNKGRFVSYWNLIGRPTMAAVTTEGLLLIGANADYAFTPLKQIMQCDKFVDENTPEYEAEMDTPMWHILLAFPTKKELDTFVSAMWAVVLARYPEKSLSRYDKNYAPG